MISVVDNDGQLALHEIATGKSWALTGAASGDPAGYVEGSRFSEDGSRLTYVRFVRQGPGRRDYPEIRKISTNGGRSRLVWRGEDDRYVNIYHWAGDDDLILATRWTETNRAEFLLIDGNTGHLVSTRPAPSVGLTGASLSPDGRYVAFETVDESTGRGDIDVWDIAAGTVTPLIRDPAEDHSPVWSPDGRHILFMSNRSGTPGLWGEKFTEGKTSGVPTRLDPDIGTGWPMGGLTRTGALFMRREIGTRDLHIVDIDPDSLTVTGQPKRVADRPLSATGSSGWSPDGTHLGFFRRDGARATLVIRSLADGREREFRRPRMGPPRKVRWESNTSVLFKADLDGVFGLQRLNLLTGVITTVWERPAFNEIELLPPPDTVLVGERLKHHVIKVDLHTGEETVVHRVPPPSTIVEMAVSSRGDRLAYSSPRGGGKGWAVYVVDLNSHAPARELLYAAPGVGSLALTAWSADDRAVFVRRNVNAKGEHDGKGHLWAIDVESGKPHHTGLTLDRGLQELQRSPDGRRLSFDAGFPYQEVWVLENAAGLLPQ